MTISIDLDSLIEYKLTPNQYVFCYILVKWGNIELRKYIERCILRKEEIKDLEEKELIVNNNLEDEFLIKNIIATSKTANLIIIKSNNAWQEFKDTFPKVTPSGRRLHNDPESCRRKYEGLIKDDMALHKHIISCLKREVLERLNRNQMDYMQLMGTYLNQKTWKVYEEDLNQSQNNGETEFKALE